MGMHRGKHPGEVALQQFQEGFLSEKKRARVSGHVKHCDRCRGILASYAVLNRTLADFARMPVPADLCDEVLASVLPSQLEMVARRSASELVPGRLWGMAGGLISLVLAGLLLFWPALSGMDSFLIQVVALFKAGWVNLYFVGRLADGLLMVLEPIRWVLLITGAMFSVLFAYMVGRRPLTSLSY